jgi:hypothetical protein
MGVGTDPGPGIQHRTGANIVSKHKFTTEKLTATKWDAATVKAKFLNDLADLMRSGFKRTKFSKALYKRLSMTFSHIAHYDIEGFYGEWFETPARQLAWVENALRHPCYGDPEYTYSDAERQFQKWLQSDEGQDLIAGIVQRARDAGIANARAMKERAEATLAGYGV